MANPKNKKQKNKSVVGYSSFPIHTKKVFGLFWFWFFCFIILQQWIVCLNWRKIKQKNRTEEQMTWTNQQERMSKHKHRTAKFIFGNTELKFDFSCPFLKQTTIPVKQTQLFKFEQRMLNKEPVGWTRIWIWLHLMTLLWTQLMCAWKFLKTDLEFWFWKCANLMIKMIIFLCLIEQLVWVWLKCWSKFLRQFELCWLKGWPKKCFWKNIFLMTWSFFVVWLCKHCADLHIHILKTIKPINKTHIFFFVSEDRFFWNQKSTSTVCFNFVLFLVSWQFDSHSFFETLTCFFWLSKYDFALRIYFIKDTFITHAHTKNSSVTPTEFSFSKKQKKEHMFQLEHKNNTKIFLLLEQSNFHKHTHKQLFSFLFCFFLFVWFDKCWIEWQVLFCFFVFLEFESNMTNKRLMPMWWSLSLLLILVMETIDILLVIPKIQSEKDAKWNWSPTQHNTFSFPFIQKKKLVSISNSLSDSLPNTQNNTQIFLSLFFCFCWCALRLSLFFLFVCHMTMQKKIVTKKTQNFKTKASSPVVPFLIFPAVVDHVLHVVYLPFVLHVFSVFVVLVSISDYVVFSLCFSATLEKEIELVLCFFFGNKQTNKPSTVQWLWNALLAFAKSSGVLPSC